MTLLTPWSALAAALLTIPLLLLLYFLKLRRRTLRIPSTLLWRQAFEDLQVNAPFQRLRFSLLLLLQLLMLLSLLFAFAQPVLDMPQEAAGRIILLIDRSASMSTVQPNGETRLDAARRAATQLIENALSAGNQTEIMLVTYSSSPQVLSGFTRQRRALTDAVASLSATHEPANLDAALQLASAFAARDDSENVELPQVVLISDGAVGPSAKAGGYSIRTDNVRFIQIAQQDGNAGSDNLGIVAFSARRDYDDPSNVLVFARLLNAATSPRDVVVTLRMNGDAVDIKEVSVPAAETESPGGEVPGAGDAVVRFTLQQPGGAVLSLTHNAPDSFAVDDTAALVLPEPLKMRIALVHPDDAPADPIIRDLIIETQPHSLQQIPASQFAQMDQRQIDAGDKFDMVIFDRVSGHRLPAIPSLTVGGVPAAVDAVEPTSPGGRRMLSWDRQHPVMRHVSLDALVYAGFGGFDLPINSTPLAIGPQGPVIAEVRTRGARHVIVGFSLVQSNWPLDLSINVFMLNVLDYLTLPRSGASGRTYQPGEPITARAEADVEQIVIDGPQRASMHTEPGAVVTLPILRLVGLYQVSGIAPPQDQIAVSLLSETESDNRTAAQLTINAQPATAASVAESARRGIWPWFVIAAIVLLVLEWLVYCWRIAR